ncbi:MAG TPA: hypothetical protein VGN77_00555 [Steroidobacteraceae bacterium]|nr:hypothetical protein [Steroidobacteraceae bacterium]
MNGPLDSGTSDGALHRAIPAQRASAPNLASFARALRQRGLLARVDSLPSISEGWTDVPELWIASNAIYEAHLRRVGMEQALATLRSDSGHGA